MKPGNDYQQVLVIGINEETGIASCQDEVGTALEIPLGVRQGKGGWPRPGEVWYIQRKYGRVVFASVVGDAQPPAIGADRDTADPLAIRLLDTLIDLGLVRDEAEDSLSAETDYDPEELPELDEDDDPGDGGDDAPASEDEPRIAPVPLWLATFNASGYTQSNQRVIRDFRRLRQTAAELVGIQEMHRKKGYRDPAAKALEAGGLFKTLRREDGPGREWNWIAYRPRTLTLHDWGDRMLTDNTGGLLARWAQWAQFRHKRTGLDFTFINTHFIPPARSPANYLDQVEAVAAMIETYSEYGPVFISGSLNADYRDTDDRNHVGWTGIEFPAVGATANWAALGQPAGIGTLGLPLVDYVYVAAEPEVASMQSQQIVRGCLSQHRPVLVKVRLRRVDTDI